MVSSIIFLSNIFAAKGCFIILIFFLDCTKKTEAFETGVEACRQKTGADACTCWTKATLGADVETIKKCTRKNFTI